MAVIETKLKPWMAPNFAVVDEPDGRSIPVDELPASTLRAMAHEWLADLYDKAGKPYDFRFD